MNRSRGALVRLRSAAWIAREETQAIFALLEGDAGRTRAVGGIVRDTLIGLARSDTDVDMATEIPPREVMARAQRAGIAAYPTGLEHGTVTLRIGEFVVEVTTLREDVETDGRRARVKFGTDWRRDAERRDFTLNALYANADGTLFDPLGGLADCLAGHVRFIGDADQRIAEDRLRIFRFFRFCASHGRQQLDADGLAAVQRFAGDLSAVSAERVGAEMRRMLSLPRIAKVLGVMARIGILELRPELLKQLARYERLDGGVEFAERLALLAGTMGADHLQAAWRLSNGEMSKAGELLAAAKLLNAGQLHEAAYRHGPHRLGGLRVAAALGGWGDEQFAAARDSLEALVVPHFPVNGNDLAGLGMAPGRSLGVELKRLEAIWIESGFTLDRKALLERVRR